MLPSSILEGLPTTVIQITPPVNACTHTWKTHGGVHAQPPSEAGSGWTRGDQTPQLQLVSATH